MKKVIFGLLSFVAGIGTGILIGKTVYEKKYRDIYEEETQTMREHYNKKRKETEEVAEKIKDDRRKEILKNYNSESEEPKDAVINNDIDPYIMEEYELITQDEFENEQISGYTKKSVTLYADGIVVDENEERLDETQDELFGNLTADMSLADDIRYIRNNDSQTEYFVEWSPVKYSDYVVGSDD